MSTRAIAPVVGVSKAASPATSAQVSHLKTRAALAGEYAADSTLTTEEFEDSLNKAGTKGGPSREDNEKSVATMTKNVIGRDGKSYTRQEPSRRRNRPLPESCRRRVVVLDDLVRKLAKDHDDDRFTDNRQALRRHADLLEEHGSKLLVLAEDLRGGAA